MEGNRGVATWLIAHRRAIEAAMHGQLGPAAPSAASPETEALRRFRTYSSAALTRDQAPSPNLDGVRVNQRRLAALLEAWIESATLAAGPDGALVQGALEPLVAAFSLALRTSQNGRTSSGRARSTRRAVAAAIDRVADAFLAIDTDSGRIEDANPAAGSLLGVKRDALLGVEALSFVPADEHRAFWAHLDSSSEGNEGRTTLSLIDVHGRSILVDTTFTSFTTRSRTLALLLARPIAQPAQAASARFAPAATL